MYINRSLQTRTNNRLLTKPIIGEGIPLHYLNYCKEPVLIVSIYEKYCAYDCNYKLVTGLMSKDPFYTFYMIYVCPDSINSLRIKLIQNQLQLSILPKASKFNSGKP